MTMSTLDWMSFCQHSTSAKIGIIVSIRGKFTSKNDNLLNDKDITTNLERKFKIPDPHVLTIFSSKKLPLQLSVIFQEIPKNIVKFYNTWQIHIYTFSKKRHCYTTHWLTKKSPKTGHQPQTLVPPRLCSKKN